MVKHKYLLLFILLGVPTAFAQKPTVTGEVIAESSNPSQSNQNSKVSKSFPFIGGTFNRHNSKYGHRLVIKLNPQFVNRTIVEEGSLGDISIRSDEKEKKDCVEHTKTFTFESYRPDLSTIQLVVNEENHVERIALSNYTYAEKARIFFKGIDSDFAKQMYAIFDAVIKTNQLNQQGK